MRGTFSAGDASLRQLALHSQRVGGPGAPADEWATEPGVRPSRSRRRRIRSRSPTRRASSATRRGRHRRPVAARPVRLPPPVGGRRATSFVVDTPFVTVTRAEAVRDSRRPPADDDGGAFDGIVAITFTPEALRTFFRTIDVGRAARSGCFIPTASSCSASRRPPIRSASRRRTNPIFNAAQRSNGRRRRGPARAGRPGDAERVPRDATARRSSSPCRSTAARCSPTGGVRSRLDRRFSRAACDDGGHAARRCSGRWTRRRRPSGSWRARSRRRRSGSRRPTSGWRARSRASRRARRETEDAARLKDEFLMTVSHELRTPLTAIHGWAQMLATGRARRRDSTKPRSQTIERNARAQTRLIDDLLDVSRVDQRQAAARGARRSTSPTSCATRSRPCSPAADAKSHPARDRTSIRDAGTIAADPDRLQQIVWNLLSNAIKFTPAGGRVSVRAARAGDDSRSRSRDTGARHRGRVPAARVRAVPPGGRRHARAATAASGSASRSSATSSSCTAAR